MPETPTPLDLDAIRATYGKRFESMSNSLYRTVGLLVAEVERLRAEYARAARPAPAWDEEAAWREAVRLYPTEHVGYDHPVPSNCRCDECYRREVQRDAYVAGRLATVRDHQPVKPDREAVARLIDPEAFSDWSNAHDPRAQVEQEARRGAALRSADALRARFTITPKEDR